VTLTLDASAAFELVVAHAPQGNWVRSVVAGHDFVVPTVFRYELLNLIRREFARGRLGSVAANSTVGVAMAMPLKEYGIDALVGRAWELRGSFTFTDSSYIAVAELTRTPRLTLDLGITRGPKVGCEIIVPPEPPP